MDFFDRQDRARRRSRWLLLWFLVAVVGIVAAVYLVVAAFLVTRGNQVALFSPRLFGAVALGVSSVIGVASLYKVVSLREGGEAVARLLGGRPVDPNSGDRAERRLLNVVDEMAIAAGVPVPAVYVLEREDGINAFAAGFTSGDAVIGVTRGAVELLDRDELQGVVAHEFSHILNGDMRLNLKLIGLLHGILVLTLIGVWILRSGRFSDRRGIGIGILVFGIALWVIGSIGAFFARLIKSGVSRQREMLADASAVQFTRNPLGLAGALRKIGALSAGSQLKTSQAEQASHLFFSEGVRSKPGGRGLLSTHPPLEDRIRALDPAWDGSFPAIERAQRPAATPKATKRSPPPTAGVSALAGDGPAAAPFDAEETTRRAGSILHDALEHASAWIAGLPEELRRELREPAEAEALIYALLLVADDEEREKQLDILRRRAGARAPALLAAVGRSARALRAAGGQHRLPVVDLAMPALRRMSLQQHREFLETVRALVDCDGELDLFEFTLNRMLARHLAPHFERPEPSRVQHYALRGVAHSCSVLLSSLAYVGSEGDAAEAFAAGARRLGDQAALELLPPTACDLAAIDRALRQLAQLAPRLKRSLVEAIGVTIAWDRRVTVAELELLRAVCDTLDVPVPPFE